MPDSSKEFIKAAKQGDLEKLKNLLTQDQTLLNARDTDNSTALHCAAWKGHRELIAFLITSGADVQVHNSNDHWGTTALHAAAHANQAAIVLMLIEAGADVNAKDMNDQTPLFHTTFHKATAAAKVLTQHGAV